MFVAWRDTCKAQGGVGLTVAEREQLTRWEREPSDDPRPGWPTRITAEQMENAVVATLEPSPAHFRTFRTN